MHVLLGIVRLQVWRGNASILLGSEVAVIELGNFP